MLREGAIRRGILCADGYKPVRKGLDGGGEGGKCRRGSIVCSDGERGIELLEEAERGGGDCKRALVVPDDERVIQLLCDCKRGEIPWLEDGVRREERWGLADARSRLGMCPRGIDQSQRGHWRECQS